MPGGKKSGRGLSNSAVVLTTALHLRAFAVFHCYGLCSSLHFRNKCLRGDVEEGFEGERRVASYSSFGGGVPWRHLSCFWGRSSGPGGAPLVRVEHGTVANSEAICIPSWFCSQPASPCLPHVGQGSRRRSAGWARVVPSAPSWGNPCSAPA